MGSWYPSAKVRLRVRFDELGSAHSVPAPAVARGERRAGQSAAARVLRYSRLAGEGWAEGEGYVLEPMTTPELRATIAEGGSSDDELTWQIGAVLPQSCSVERNGIRAADTFKVELPFHDFPFDPRLVRAIGVEVYVGAVSADDFGEGKEGAEWDGEPLALVPDSAGEGQSNRRIIGFVDSLAGDWGDGLATVVMEGRALTGLLIDASLPPLVQADPTAPLTEIFSQVLVTLPAAGGLTVRMFPRGTEAPRLMRGEQSVQRHMRRRGGREARVPTQGKQEKVSYWDYLTDLAGLAGFVCYVDGTEVLVARSRTIYGSRDPVRDGVAFLPRVVEGETLAVRRMVWGRNVAKMGVERKYEVQKVGTVEVRCYDPQTRRVLIERFPPASAVNQTPPGQSGGDEKITVVRVDGVRDPAQLRRMAQSYYEQVGRQESAFTLETKALVSYCSEDDEASTFPDLLDLRSGDPLQLRMARQEDFDTLTQLEALDAAGRGSPNQGPGVPPRLAPQDAELHAAAGFQDVFRVRDATIDFSRDTGVGIKMGLMNYVEVREEQDLPEGEEAEPPQQSAVDRERRQDSHEEPRPVRHVGLEDDRDDPLYPLDLTEEDFR